MSASHALRMIRTIGAFRAMYRCESTCGSRGVARISQRARRRAVDVLARGASWLGAFAIACSSAGGGHEAAAPANEPALHRGALTDFVPAAGLRWLVLGSPQQLAREPGLASL